MEIYEKGEYELFIHQLQEHHLEMNEYKKHCDDIPTDYYLNLLDAFIECVKGDRDLLKKREEIINGYEKICDDYEKLVMKRLGSTFNKL